jgi:hypothetical protein
MIETAFILTCLTTFASRKDKLLFLDLILVKELLNNAIVLHKVGVSENRTKRVLKCQIYVILPDSLRFVTSN